MVNGFTQVIALATDASAVATAPMSVDTVPKYLAMSVETGLPRAAVRRTATRTRFDSPVGLLRNSTSVGTTDTLLAMTWF